MLEKDLILKKNGELVYCTITKIESGYISLYGNSTGSVYKSTRPNTQIYRLPDDGKTTNT